MKDSERMKNSQILFIRYCLLFVVWGLLFVFLFAAPAHAYWTQTDWSGGDSQFFWYDVMRYDTAVNIDDTCVIDSDKSISIINAGESADIDTGVLLSSTYDADSPVVWKTIKWNDPSLTTPGYEHRRGDSRLRKDEATGLVALWHFDEGFDVSGALANDSTVYDESINNNSGIVHGCTWGKWTVPNSTADAVFGSALNFDWNNSDYVTFGKTANSIKTIEFWIKTDSADTPILELNDSADTVYVSGGNVAASFADTTIYIDGNQGTALGTGSWHHVAVTKTTTGIDGIDISIGKAGSDYFSGAIDEVAIYSRAKTAEEIWQDARGTQMRLRTQTTSSILDGTGSDSPVGLWHFNNQADDPSSNDVYDSSVYKNKGTKTGATWSQWGVFGKCLQFDGTDDCVSVGNIGHTVKSIEFWINTDTSDTSILELSSGDTVYVSGGDVAASFADTTIYIDGSQGTALGTGSWHHVAVTTTTERTASDVNIGKAGTDYFGGYLDEVGFYNKVRTSTQIAIDARGGQPWSPWSPYYKKGDEDDIVLFKDDFNDGVVPDWSKYYSTGTSATWLIDNIADDTGALKITGLTSGDTGIIQTSANTNWYNYKIETKVKIKTLGLHAQAGVILNWNDPSGSANGYAALLCEEGASSQLRLYAMDTTAATYGVENGGSSILDSYTFSGGLTAGQWYTLKAQYDGSHIRVYLGDTNYITYNVADYTYKGYAGLIAANAETCFDNFKVFPIDRYCRYEATLTDNINNDTTPYLYWVRLSYEETTRDDTLWSKIWQDRYGIHQNYVPEDVTWAPEDQEQTEGGTWNILNYAEIDSADTTWCYNLENYDNDMTIANNPDGELRVFVEVPVPATDHVNLRLGYRKIAALTAPGTWPDNETDYKWDDGDDWISFDPSAGDCTVEYTALSGDTEIWKCTFSETQITDNFSKEAGYILWSRAVSSDGGTEPSPETFEPDSTGDRQDTSIIYMMRDITSPGSSVEGWPWQVGQSGYQPVVGRDNDKWIVDSLQLKGIESSSQTDVPALYRVNSEDIWINYKSQDDSGIMVEARDKNPDSARADDCSGLKEKSFDDSPTRYVYSTTACGREWRNPDIIPSIIDITKIGDWAECDTDYNVATGIRYLALGNLGDPKKHYPLDTYDNPMPNLGTRSSKKGRDILIQFAQKDKAGNWGYSHPCYDHYYACSSAGGVGLGYYINYDITKPVPRIISAPREVNPSKYASFKFDDDSADDSSLFCAFSTRLELNDDTDKTLGAYSVVTGWTSYLPWLPTSDNASKTFSPINYSPYWYRCSVKAKDEALNESDDYDTYYFQCMPVPNTIIYSGPSGIVVTSSISTYTATFKFEGEGGNTSIYNFACSIDGSAWTACGSSVQKSSKIFIGALGYGNHVFRVRAANNSGDPVSGTETDKTPASVAFTIVNPAQIPTIAPPSNPVKYWRQESE